jgi:hypothetical protein
VKIVGERGAYADVVDRRIEETDCAPAISDRLLVNHSNEACPTRRGKAGAAVAAGERTVVDGGVVEIGFSRDIR